MFNYVNFGNVGKDAARAFDIHSLVQLHQFKTMQGPFPNFTGLHFVVMRLLAEQPDLTPETIGQELKMLKKASDVSLSGAQSIIDSLQGDAQFLRSELKNFPVAYGGKPVVPRKKSAEKPRTE